MDNFYNRTSLGNHSEGGFSGAGGHSSGGSTSYLTVVVAAGVLISLPIVGNLAIVLVTSLRMDGLRRFSSVYIPLCQLAVADVGVSCFFMSAQISWIRMESRKGANSLVIDMGACQTFAYLSAFSLYLSGFTVAAIAMDRFLDLIRPGQHGDCSAKRAKFLAWIPVTCAVVIAISEAMVYRVEVHPFRTWIKKRTLAGAFGLVEAEVAYALCRLLAFPFLPFAITLFCYLRIWQKLSSMAIAGNVGHSRENSSLDRAKLHVIRLSVAICVVFHACWTPYSAMVLWSWSKPQKVDQIVLKVVLMLACISPCLNPVIHAYFYMKQPRREQDSMIEMTSV